MSTNKNELRTSLHELALRSFWYAGVGSVRPQRQFMKNGVVLSYEGDERVISLGKKDIDPAAAQISGLLPDSAGRAGFTGASRVVDFLRSELERSEFLFCRPLMATLPHRIAPDEELLAACTGQYRDRAALALLTHTRLLICDRADKPTKHVEVPVDELLGAETGEGIWRGRIGIRVKGDRHDFSFSNKGDTTRMAEAIERLVDTKRTRARLQ